MAQKLSDDGLAGESTGGKVVLINPGDCLILLGSVVGCFEGIGLVLPIQVRCIPIDFFGLHLQSPFVLCMETPAPSVSSAGANIFPCLSKHGACMVA